MKKLVNRAGLSVALLLAGLWCTGSDPAAKGPRSDGPGSQPPQPETERFEFTQVHMGMPVRIVLYASGEDQARRAATAGFRRIETLEQVLSDYRPDSELRRLEVQAGSWIPVSRALFEVLQHAIAVARASGGAFDPTVGPFVALWRRARAASRLPSEWERDAARAAVGWSHLELRPADPSGRLPNGWVRLRVNGMRLDLGGVAKGYILQDVLRILRDGGTPRALVEAGGDIVAGDPPPDRTGWAIATPKGNPAFHARASSLVNAALATSGPSFQYAEIDGVRYSHVIDPRTGLGVTSPVVARVIASHGATADALATALTVMGPAGARALLERFPDVMASVSAEPYR